MADWSGILELAETSERFPRPSATGHALAAAGEQVTASELLRLLEAEPRVAGWIALLAGEEPARAVEAHGPAAVRELAFAFGLLDANRAGWAGALPVVHFWDRALGTAVLARGLAVTLERPDALRAFGAGLLSQVGRLVIALAHATELTRWLQASRHPRESDWRELEHALAGIRGSELSARLLERWGFEGYLPCAVSQIGRGASAGELDGGAPEAAVLLRSAATLSDHLLSAGWTAGDGGEGRDARDWELSQALRNLGLDIASLGTTQDEALRSWSEWQRALQLEATSLPLLEEVAAVQPRSANGWRPEAESAKRVTRILVVDDDEKMLRLIRYHLTRQGYEVVVAQDGAPAVELVARHAPQLVVTDWMMPGTSGVTLCEQLNASEVGRKIYKLMVTARGDDDQIIEAFAAGADDYIVKPFNPKVLIARVRAGERVVRMREALEQREIDTKRHIAELGLLTRKLRVAALTDPLTELHNRRYGLNRLKTEWEDAQSSGSPLSLILMDVDHFKRINDEHGHDEGDRVLREVAQVLRNNCRRGDVLCRLGGEEFLAIIIGLGAERARVCAERLREAIEQRSLARGERAPVTMSLGVAANEPDLQSVDELIKRADRALYDAKEGGRNRSVVWSARPDAPPQD